MDGWEWFLLVTDKSEVVVSGWEWFLLVIDKSEVLECLDGSGSTTSLLSVTRRNHSHPSTLGIHSCQSQGETTPIQSL